MRQSERYVSVAEGRRLDPEDPFGPPEIPVECECVHCEQKFQSNTMVYDRQGGFWTCPVDECDGTGFGMDIHRV